MACVSQQVWRWSKRIPVIRPPHWPPQQPPQPWRGAVRSLDASLCKPGYLRRKAVSGSSATESTDHLAVPFASHAKRRGFSTSPFRIGCEDGSRMATVVKEHVFEANGCQYQFHCVRPFAWEDGTQFHLPKRVTLQALKRIDRNFAWWSTSHERTQRQRFKWVSPMHQKTRHAVTVDRIGFGAGVDTCRS